METRSEDVDYSMLTKEELINTVIKPLKYINDVQSELIKQNNITLNKLKSQLELLIEDFKERD